MKKIYTCILFSTILLIVSSCSKDDDNREPNDNNDSTKSFTVNAAAEYLDNHDSTIRKEWIYISNSKGEIVDSGEVENGKSFTLTYPESSEQLYITRLRVTDNVGVDSEYANIYTYELINDTGWELSRNIPQQSIGSSGIRIAGSRPEGWSYDFRLSGGGAHQHWVEDEYIDIELSHHKNPADFFFLLSPSSAENIAPKYIVQEALQIGKNDYQIDIADVNKEMISTSVTLPDNDGGRIVMYAYEKENVYENRYYLQSYRFNDPETTIDAYTAGSDFEAYEIHLDLTKSNDTYSIKERGAVKSSYKLPTFGLTINNTSYNNFRVSTTGTFDFYNLYFTSNKSGHESITWNYLGKSKANITGNLPDIPAEAKTAYSFLINSGMELYSATLNEFDHFSNYADYMTKAYNTTSSAQWTQHLSVVRIP